MKTAAILTLLAFAALCPAQTKPDIQLPPNVRMYQPKNITPDRAQRVAQSVQNIVSILQLSWDGVAHAFVLRGTAQDLDMAEALLKRFDVAAPRVELTIYLVRAFSGPPSPTPVGSQPGNPVPQELRVAIDEMKSSFVYDRYTLWDQILVQPTSNGGEVQGVLTSEAGNYTYTVSYQVSGGSPVSEGKTVSLGNFTFSMKMPVTFRSRAAVNPPETNFESHIRTDVTVRENQKLVLGKIRLLPNGSGDLFLVLATKVY
jgi:hypothetical protein